MKASGNKLLVEYDLPTDYGLSRIMEQKGLPSLESDLFYVITKNKKLVVREYLEDGFTCQDTVIDTPYTFVIEGSAVGGMGLWEVTYRVVTDSGDIKNIYELNAVIRDMC